MQKRRSGCSRSTLAGENAGHSKHSIQERRSIVWQQNTSAVNARSLHSLSFSAPVTRLRITGRAGSASSLHSDLVRGVVFHRRRHAGLGEEVDAVLRGEEGEEQRQTQVRHSEHLPASMSRDHSFDAR